MVMKRMKKAPSQGLLLADRTGLEPATSAVTGRHSNQLNYRSVRTAHFYFFTVFGLCNLLTGRLPIAIGKPAESRKSENL